MATFFAKKTIPWASISKSQALRKLPCRTGYIVLLPETVEPQDVPEPYQTKTNGPPAIEGLNADKCIAIVSKYSQEFDSGLGTLEEKLKGSNRQPLDIFKEVLDPLENLTAPLIASWGLMNTLHLTKSDILSKDYYMKIHERASTSKFKKFNSKAVHDACKNAKTYDLPEEKQRLVNKYVCEGTLNGLDLNDSDSVILMDVLLRINRAKTEIRQKVQYVTEQFKHPIYDNAVIHDFPQDLLQLMASERGGPWVVTLKPNIYNQFMEYCPDRELRWNTWIAKMSRCSHRGDSRVDTSTKVEEIRSLRRKQANLLGFETFADMSMQTKMAGSLQKVEDMLGRLYRKAHPAQQKELETLQRFAEERGFKGALQLWDIPFWKRKQLRTLYSFDEDIFRDYFPFPLVLEKLFTLCEQLFGLHIIKSDSAKTWHPDTHFYQILNVNSRSPIASFFLDPYTRNEKLGTGENGWMVPMRNRSTLCGHDPIATLIFNFRPPTGLVPSMLGFRDVHLLFQKFGQGLQHLLTTANYSDVSGRSNIGWDVSEVCSDFMSHWLYQPNFVESMSSHYETGESIPKEIVKNLQKVPQLLAGHELCKNLYLSTLDIQLHSSKNGTMEDVRALWPKFFTVPLLKFDVHPCSFTEIFAEEWAAAYYSHLWSNIIAADIFSAFQEVGLDKKDELADVGRRLRCTFLELGGACHQGEVFRRFRGRDPSPNALLWSLGLKKIPDQTLV